MPNEGRPDQEPATRGGVAHARGVTLTVDLPNNDEFRAASLIITAYDGGLSRRELDILHRRKNDQDRFLEEYGHRLRRWGASPDTPEPEVMFADDADSALRAFSWACSRMASPDQTISQQALERVLRGPEAVVPAFGSPPSEWLSLKSVLEQASSGAIAVTTGGQHGLPGLLIAYGGGLVLLRIVLPIVTEIGQATAEGIGAKIRKSFGLSPASSGPSGGEVGEAASPSEIAPSAPEDSGGRTSQSADPSDDRPEEAL